MPHGDRGLDRIGAEAGGIDQGGDGGVERDEAVAGKDPDERRGEALGDGVGAVQVGRRRAPVTALEDDVAVVGDEHVQGMGQVRMRADGGVSGQKAVVVQGFPPARAGAFTIRRFRRPVPG